MKRVKIAAAVVLVAVLMLAAGCSDSQRTQNVTQNNNYNIVTSFYPVYIAAINVAKDIPGVTVTNMTEPQTGCLHDYTLTAKDMKKLADADVLIINGAGMESFMDKVLEQNPELKVLDSSAGIELLKDGATGEDNPHIWVSISGAIEQVRNIGEQLSEADGAHAEQYRKNAEDYISKLKALKDKMHSRLDRLQNKDIITFHEAFPYFAREFNLNIKAVVEREPGTEPSAGELAGIVDIIRQTGVRALFAEPQYSRSAADLIAKETGARVYILDPVVTGEANGDTEAYIKAMRANLAVLEEALNADAK